MADYCSPVFFSVRGRNASALGVGALLAHPYDDLFWRKRGIAINFDIIYSLPKAFMIKLLASFYQLTCRVGNILVTISTRGANSVIFLTTNLKE